MKIEYDVDVLINFGRELLNAQQAYYLETCQALVGERVSAYTCRREAFEGACLMVHADSRKVLPVVKSMRRHEKCMQIGPITVGFGNADVFHKAFELSYRPERNIEWLKRNKRWLLPVRE